MRQTLLAVMLLSLVGCTALTHALTPRPRTPEQQAQDKAGAVLDVILFGLF